MKTYIQFKKQRELGEILTDTFGFIRNEFKPLIKTIFQVAGPYLVVFLLALVFYVYTVGDSFSLDVNALFPYKNISILILAYVVYIIGILLAYTFTTATILYYIKAYIENDGVIDVNVVKQEVNSRFLGFLGLSFLKGITYIVAIAICCLPIFYVLVPMAIVLPIYVFKSTDATTAYSESFPFIKEEFWITLATIIVLGIIVAIISSIFSIPTVIYTWVKMGVFSGEIDPTSIQSFADPIYIIINVLSSFFQFALNMVMVVGMAFIYFNINERKYFTGTLEKIQSIGNSED